MQRKQHSEILVRNMSPFAPDIHVCVRGGAMCVMMMMNSVLSEGDLDNKIFPRQVIP